MNHLFSKPPVNAKRLFLHPSPPLQNDSFIPVKVDHRSSPCPLVHKNCFGPPLAPSIEAHHRRNLSFPPSTGNHAYCISLLGSFVTSHATLLRKYAWAKP